MDRVKGDRAIGVGPLDATTHEGTAAGSQRAQRRMQLTAEFRGDNEVEGVVDEAIISGHAYAFAFNFPVPAITSSIVATSRDRCSPPRELPRFSNARSGRH